MSNYYQGFHRRLFSRGKVRRVFTKAIKPWREDFADHRKARGNLDPDSVTGRFEAKGVDFIATTDLEAQKALPPVQTAIKNPVAT